MHFSEFIHPITHEYIIYIGRAHLTCTFKISVVHVGYILYHWLVSFNCVLILILFNRQIIIIIIISNVVDRIE